ncbi:histone acetylation protein-domain-containing protein [Xylariales sp. PMI_506]|nr:histone acetylation protein-domain-containing protein [Xylariales sp. PMI_506]
MVNPKQPVISTSSLVDELARSLPKDVKFTAHHLSTPPTITEPLCYPPAYPSTSQEDSHTERRARKPLKTYCEKHFLAISITSPGQSGVQVLALALEVYIYTTAYSTIIFISKADSTGYLTLLNLRRGTPSPIREITTTFIAYLVANRRRKGIQCVVNLFARAQAQYLFPGSVKNKGKHVLDDRGLVKWWCRVLNPLLEQAEPTSKTWNNIHAYLTIPGLDAYEMRAFLPRSSSTASSWTLGHPLEHISPYLSDSVTFGARIPPRCLIPIYPDDPKARFVLELEESTSERAKLAGGWKSPKTLDEFWEMMAFRQECSSGRMTGFVWVVFDPPSTKPSVTLGSAPVAGTASFQTSNANQSDNMPQRPSTPERPENMVTPGSAPTTPAKPRRKKAKKVLRGRIIPRQPHIKTHQRTSFPKLNKTAYYYWPERGRGKAILDETGYKRSVELLLHLEFGTLEQAITSSTRWINEVNVGKDWGLEIVGQQEAPVPIATGSAGAGAINDLSGMVKRKRSEAEPASDAPTTVNTLGAGLIRKKAKPNTDEAAASVVLDVEPRVNTLAAGLVRKKPKAN